MNPLAVFCPNSGRPILSGVETDWTTLLRIGSRTLRVFCLECGEHHDVRVSEGYLAQAQAELSAPALSREPRLERLLSRLCLRG